MSLTGLLQQVASGADARDVAEIVDSSAEGDVVAVPGLVPFLVGALAEREQVPGAAPVTCVITPTTRAAEEIGAALRQMLPAGSVADLPAWETLPHERLSPRADTVARRLATLRRLAHPEEDEDTTAPLRVLLAPVRSALQPMVAGLGELVPVRLHEGDTVSIDELSGALVDAAYTRVDMVERRGEFAVRGGIVDVFPPTDPHPVRVELFGDEVDEVRWFSIADQRSLDRAEHGLYAPPCRELLLTDEVRERARALEQDLPGIADMLDKIANGIAVEGMESLTPVLVRGMQALTDVLPPGSAILALDPERIRSRADDLVATTDEFLAAAWSNATDGGTVPVDVSTASFLPVDQVREEALAAGHSWHRVAPFGLDADVDVATRAAAQPGFGGDVEGAVADLGRRARDGWSVVVTTAGAGSARHWTDAMVGAELPARLAEDLDRAPEPGTVTVTRATLTTGFVAEDLRLAVVSEKDLTGKAPGATATGEKKMPSRRRNVVDPLQLRPGDFVVHDQHGVGRFKEMVSRTVGSGRSRTTREYLVIEYAPAKKGRPGDLLHVPSEQLGMVTRYVGGEEPSVNRMGGSDWSRTKAKARKAVREIAGELVRLYAARQASRGHTFGPDTPWQRELEDAFPYIETPDQMSTVDEVKRDMERGVPMDRLVSGDVGYGKTEIAVRAAFKAVQEGKQVAVLVPTTLLAQQHYETFTDRYAGFPVTVRSLSRFQSGAESGQTVTGLQEGAVDVVIGTHRLLTGSVRFKDLGLVIVDEEQRFGVEHKETLKAMRANVDVLSMSATPIPRTLEMAITGIREMSTLATPPEERHPVLTYVGPQQDAQITAAVRRELLREGQVFYVHNRVEDIARVAAHVAELVPDARVRVAHGKMSERQLEQVFLDFWNREFDVLVCTTIIETGLDVTSANTLIVENTDRFGLSQLHQLRGRVGRGRERAYAYFLYPADRPLSETANDRLTTLATHSDLGAGTQIAMKDLEIRGAGNLLGGEQSGQIAGVGFDLYARMVGEAVEAFRGGGTDEEESTQTRLELPLDAHLPHDYVPSERLRLEAYAKLSNATTDAEIASVRDELVDRYGEPPEPVTTLLAAAALRIRCQAAGLTDVIGQGKNVRLMPLELPDSAAMRLTRLYPGAVQRPAARAVQVPFPTTAKIGGTPLRDQELIDWIEGFLDTIVEPALQQSAPASA